MRQADFFVNSSSCDVGDLRSFNRWNSIENWEWVRTHFEFTLESIWWHFQDSNGKSMHSCKPAEIISFWIDFLHFPIPCVLETWSIAQFLIGKFVQWNQNIFIVGNNLCIILRAEHFSKKIARYSIDMKFKNRFRATLILPPTHRHSPLTNFLLRSTLVDEEKLRNCFDEFREKYFCQIFWILVSLSSSDCWG